MNAFKTHPSVRMKGTENNYEPVQCMAPQCPNKTPHMHCPFCTKTESFVDPVILKAHYRVKHVDKGIEFAGLKILRCCDHCDIVGTIKGVKEFKGAHWHCYKCKNGFNRRDEAVKHYRTHFRNQHTTFQIQIAQEINQMYPLGHEVETATDTLSRHGLTTIHPALTEAVMSTTTSEMGSNNQSESITNGRSAEGEVHVSVAANETVGTTEGQTIMIIHEDNLDAGQEHTNASQENCTFQINSASGTVHLANMEEKADLQQRLFELQQSTEQLEVDKAQLEQEVEQLKLQVQVQGQELSAYQKREQELLAQLSIPLEERIHELLSQLKAEHEDLLHQQLAVLRKTYLAQLQPGAGDHGDIQHSIVVVPTEDGGDGPTDRLPLREQTTETLVIEDVVGNTHLVTSTCGTATTATVVQSPETISANSDDVTKTVNSSGASHVQEHVTMTITSEQLQSMDVSDQTNIVITSDIDAEPPTKRAKEDT